MTVFLSLGSNLGDRKENLLIATEQLRTGLKQITVSSIYETKPLYFEKQPKFLNIVLRGQNRSDPQEFLKWVLQIELEMGRKRNMPMGPRCIDIDILLYGDLVIQQESLVVPHPGIKERQFVLVPLLELEPNLIDPESRKPLADYLDKLDDQGVYTFSVWDYTHSH